ncbi:MAG: hypothetical protein WB493_18290 [Anaeromyxobacteraceae bacterium]
MPIVLLAVAALASGAEPARAPGARAEGAAWTVALELPDPVVRGKPASARVVVTARAPYHVNLDYPMSFRSDAASTAAFPGPRVPLGEGALRVPCKDHPDETCSIAAPLPFTPPAGGEARLAGTVSFSVCNPDRCIIEKVMLSAAAPSR